ncbi:MAG: hypothetical protein ACI4CT_00525 [Lachnospiraceae bacterium]
MKKVYVTPMMECLRFKVADIISASTDTPEQITRTMTITTVTNDWNEVVNIFDNE